MTNKQYLTKALSGFGVDDDVIDIILLKGGLCPEERADIQACDLSTYHRLSVVLQGTIQNVSEGGYSVSWNVEALKVYYNALCKELGKENVLFARPKIRNKSNVW